MSKLRVYFEESPDSTPLDTPLEAMLITLILFAPLALGSIDPKFEMALQIGIALTAGLFGVKLTLYPQTRFVWSWIYMPIAAFVLFAGLQLIPLPQSFVTSLSPNTVKMKQDLLSDLPNVSQIMQKVRLSFYAEPTLRQLRQVLMVSAIFVMVLNQFRTLATIKRLLVALSVLGAFCAVLAILQIVTGSEKIYWYIDVGGGHANAGTFANHSHFSQMMNLCIGAMLGLFFLLLHEQLGNHYQASDLFSRLRTEEGRSLWLLLAAIVISMVAILMSLSRGGMLGMLVASIVTVSLYSIQNREGGFGWIGAMLAAVIFSIVVYFAFDRVAERYADLHDLQPASYRLAMVRGCLDCWKDFPLAGIGLGAFRYVFPRYDRAPDYSFATHAENEYAQLLMETGVIGAVIIGVFVLMIFAAYIGAMRHRSSPYAVLAIGLAFGWLAILVQSFTDFGQHMPGVAVITATVTALLISVAKATKFDPAKSSDESAGWPVLRGFCTIVVLAVGGAASMSAISIWQADSKWLGVLDKEDAISRQNWQVDPQRVIQMLRDARDVTEIRPGSVIYKSFYNQLRLGGATMARDPKSGAIMLNDELLMALKDIAGDLDAVRPLCPTYGPAVAIAGIIRQFYLHDASGALLIEKAATVWPNDSAVLRASAQLAAEKGEWDRTLQFFSRAIALRPSDANDAIDLLVARYHQPERAVKLIGESPAAAHLVDVLQANQADAALVNEARRNWIAQELRRLQGRVVQPEEWIDIARQYAAMGDLAKADEHYRRAVDSAAASSATRMRYAEFLGKTGRIEDALKQIEVVLSLDPFNDAAVNLQKQLRAPRKKDAED